MRLLSKLLSRLLHAAVISIMIFAFFANFLIIAQALFAPLSVVEGDSMSPCIKTNDAVYFSGTDSSRLSEGDIVVFNDPENYRQRIIHRVAGLQEEDGVLFAVTKGDANETNDPFAIPVNSIHGKVSLILPGGGIFLSFLRSYPGFIICVLCPFAVVLLYLIANWYLEKTKPGEGIFARRIIHCP